MVSAMDEQNLPVSPTGLAGWSGRHVRRIWIIGGAIELLLILAIAVPSVYDIVRLHRAEAELALAPPPPAADIRAFYDWYRLRNPSASLVALPSGDTVLVLPSGVDTFSLKFRNGYLTGLGTSKHIQPEVTNAVEAIGHGLNSALDQLVVLAAVVYLAIPLALSLLTLVWLVKRRRMAISDIGDHSV